MHAAATRTKDTLEDDIQNAGENLRAGGRQIKKDLHNTADAVKEDAEHIARHLGRQIREVAGSAEDSVAEFTSAVSDKIRKKPVQSSLIALAAGVFLGFLFRR